MGVACSRQSDEIERLTLQTRLHPKDAYAWHRLAFAYDMDGNKKEAERLYIKAISMGETSSYLHLGRILEANGKLALALDMYRNAVANSKDQHSRDALARLEERLDKRTPNERMVDIIERGMAEQERKDRATVEAWKRLAPLDSAQP